MNDGHERTEIDEDGTGPEFAEGRYLYCAVFADADDTFSTDGIEDGAVSLLVQDGIGVVVQSVDSVYDSDELTQVQQWLLAHQQVVDEAGQTFDTPLPFRFDTIIKGDDAAVFRWLTDNDEDVREALDWLSGRWEYRIEIRWDREAIGDDVLEANEQLRELAGRTEDASEGTKFMLEKQYRKRMTDRIEARRTSLEETIYDRIEPHSVEMRRSNGDGESLSSDEDEGLETAVQLSVLAESDRELAIGEALDPVAERPAFDVRYTGPWPPYSHSPEIGDGGGAGT